MRDVSQTLIALLREAVQEWRKREGWSRETVVDNIVLAFDAHGGPKLLGFEFDKNRDQVTRMKNNADRVYRWLDDESKDTNLLPANFGIFILGALPSDIKIKYTDKLLADIGLTVRVMTGNTNVALQGVLHRLAKEGGEAQAAVIGLLDGADPAELLTARKELTEMLDAVQHALNVVESIEWKAD